MVKLMTKPSEHARRAAAVMDWGQVVANGGPPCFHIEDGCFCGRAERWQGHPIIHQFVSLRDLLDAATAELKADKARLDFLDRIGADIDEIPSGRVLNECEGRLLWRMQFEYPEITRDGSEDLRQAIDAALHPEQKEKG